MLPPDVILTSDNIAEYTSDLNRYSPLELTDILENRLPEERNLIFNALSLPLATRTFEYLPFHIQKEVLNSLPSEKAATLLNHLAPDDRTAFLEELPSEIVHQLLKILSTQERALTLKLLGYPEGSVGRLMTPDYIAVKLNWTIRHVFDYLREHAQDTETLNDIYVIDNRGVLIDDISLRDLVLAPLDAKVSTLTDYKFVALPVNESQEEAVNIFRWHDRVALPVVDNMGVLLGIVTIDDILHVAEEEDTEDIQKIGGTAALDEPYMQTSFFQLIRKRIGWLILLFVGEMLTASAMGYFQEELSKAVVLALFIPLIISSGGNSGSQASTLIIRAMALDEITLQDWWRIMRREVLAGLVLGVALGILGFVRVAAWGVFSDTYHAYWPFIAVTVLLSLIGVVLWGTLSGSMLPFILKRCGLDPATSSAPFVATLVDVVGLILYFSIALIMLQGVLL